MGSCMGEAKICLAIANPVVSTIRIRGLAMSDHRVQLDFGHPDRFKAKRHLSHRELA